MKEKQEKVKKEKKPKKVKKKREGMSLWNRFMFWFAKVITFLPRILIFPAKIIHKERLPKKSRYLAVTNHQSWVDIIYSVFTLPGRRYIIAKKELDKGFLHSIRKFMAIIFVDRENPSIGSVREVFGALNCGEAVTLYPEGTRNKENRELMEIKTGSAVFAVKSGAPVIPVMIYRRAKAFRKNYIYVGEPFDLAEYAGKKLSGEVLEEATEKIRRRMLAEMDNMDDYVQNKRWKKKNRLRFPRRRPPRIGKVRSRTRNYRNPPPEMTAQAVTPYENCYGGELRVLLRRAKRGQYGVARGGRIPEPKNLHAREIDP